MPRGRKPAAFDNSLYAKIDAVIPEAIDYCISVINHAKTDPASKEWAKLAIDASKVLISKMPERVGGDEGGAVKFEVKWQ